MWPWWPPRARRPRRRPRSTRRSPWPSRADQQQTTKGALAHAASVQADEWWRRHTESRQTEQRPADSGDEQREVTVRLLPALRCVASDRIGSDRNGACVCLAGVCVEDLLGTAVASRAERRIEQEIVAAVTMRVRVRVRVTAVATGRTSGGERRRPKGSRSDVRHTPTQQSHTSSHKSDEQKQHTQRQRMHCTTLGQQQSGRTSAGSWLCRFVTEGAPFLDVLRVKKTLQRRSSTWMTRSYETSINVLQN